MAKATVWIDWISQSKFIITSNVLYYPDIWGDNEYLPSVNLRGATYARNFIPHFSCKNDHLNWSEKSKFIITYIVCTLFIITYRANYARNFIPHFSGKNDHLNWSEKSKFIITYIVCNILTFEVIMNFYHLWIWEGQTMHEISSPISVAKTTIWIYWKSQSLLSPALSVLSWHFRW